MAAAERVDMEARPLRGPVETPDGVVAPGPHGVASDARAPVTESGVALVEGRYANALNCTHAHLRRLLGAGLVERTDRDGALAWRATGAGHRPEAGVSVRETTGPLTLEDV